MSVSTITAFTKVDPDISRPKKSRHFLMHWMSVKLPDNFQISRLVKIDEKYGKPQKNCNRIVLEIYQS